MKRLFLYVPIAVIIISFGLLMQKYSKMHPKMKSFQVQLLDSTTILSSKEMPSGKPIVLFYFSPDCEHCQKETVELKDNMRSIKSALFYFVTNDPFLELRNFNRYYNLGMFKNIILTHDFKYSFFNTYLPTGTPCLLVYDRRQRLKAVFNSEVNIPGLIKLLNNL